MGNVELVQNATLSTQPINSVDWSPDKVQKSLMNVIFYRIPCRKDSWSVLHLTSALEYV